MKALLFFLLLVNHLSLFSQTGKSAAVPGNTYAVIIGVANYENKNIPNLNFCNKDAQVFADYLQSKAGGSVPAENIRLLIDTNATTAAIYNAMDWLKDKCESDNDENSNSSNLIYFYFSGHGDLETKTKANLGFLLSYNTPANNYINNAVRLEDLNDYAHVLSVDLHARVVLITDACHSGKLAGSNSGGTYLLRKELDSVKAKEIRIASCKPEELSQENEGWGGGRGIFSYYLVNGLKGLADKNQDGTVTLNEIQQYLDSCISNDRIMKEGRYTQSPVLNGNDNFKMAVINKEELVMLQKMVSAKPPQTNHEYFFSLLKDGDALELVDYTKLNSLHKEEIPFAFIKQVKVIEDTLDYHQIKEGPSSYALQPPDTAMMNERHTKMEQLAQLLKNDSTARKLFTESMVEAFHTRGQKIINLYLEGDAAELERRRYYNSESSGYDIYPAMYSTAILLTAPQNPLSRILKIAQLYFTGVAARLKMPTVEEAKQKQLADQAMAAQKKALELEQNAAYIHNELGILYKEKKDYANAEKSFKEATQIAPEWAIPQANLCGLYAETKNVEKGLTAGHIADSLQPDLQMTSANLGVIHEVSGNLLFAEEFYRKAIDLNSRHYFPFERLGIVYMSTAQYAQADSFFYEADLRKKGYHFKGNQISITPLSVVMAPEFQLHCNIDTLTLQKDDIMSFFTWGLQDYYEKDYKNAERIFKKVIALDKTNPLVFHYMGKIFYDQKKWENAEIMFRFAIDYQLTQKQFNKYCDSVIRSKKYPYAHDCVEKFFYISYYANIEDYYFISTLYESWAHYEEAEIYYRRIIQLQPADIGGYIKLWRMLEKLARYTEAEKTIQSYAAYDKERTDRELNGFYRRMVKVFPDNGDWYYRLGLMLYERASLKSRALYFDTIIWFPKINKEVFMDFESYKKIGWELRWDKTISGSPQKVDIVEIYERSEGTILPGIKETVTFEEAIYMPRKDGITYLLKADSLLTETETLGDINFKIGNIYTWAGSKKQAFPYYAKSVDLVAASASTRLKMIDAGKAIYKNRAVLEQLIYLYEQRQINFPNQLLLAEFYIHSGQFAKANTLLTEAQAIHPYVVPAIADLSGRLYLVSHQPALAIPFYKSFLGINKKDSSAMYSIARLYAQLNNKTEALKWLQMAMENGFRFSWVLKADPSWINIRDTATWNEMIKKFPMKIYSGAALVSK